MDPFVAPLAALLSLLLLDVLAVRYGTDSRDGMGDDRGRPSDPPRSFPFWR